MDIETTHLRQNDAHNLFYLNYSTEHYKENTKNPKPPHLRPTSLMKGVDMLWICALTLHLRTSSKTWMPRQTAQ
jgi:hypothetical protein